MRILALTILFIAVAYRGQGQINMLRYNDNFSYVKQESVSKHGFDQLKHIPLKKGINVSLGGEIREQLQYYQNFNFGDVPSQPGNLNVWQLWHRAMIHTNIEIGNKTRFFAQAGSTYRFLNPNPAIPEIDENRLSLHQLFVDHRFSSRWMARIGRQEISYGAHRLITFREGPNTRLAFDAAVIKYQTEKKKLDIFAISPTISRAGVFDDKALKDLIAGSYGTARILSRKLLIDYYFMFLKSNRRKYNYTGGNEQREIVGIRLHSENPRLNYETEYTYQFGRFNNLRINAFSFFTDISYVLLQHIKFSVGFAGNCLSGDKNANDGELNTYNPLFSKPQYGLTSALGASNLITVHPYFKLVPIKSSTIYVGSHFMWRQSNKDGIYSPDGTEVRPRPEKLFAAADKRIGTLLFLETTYQLNRNASMAFDASHFLAEDFIEHTGRGKDITYLSFKVGFKF